MGYTVGQNFISGQPPLLLFTVCLTAFGLTMIILAYVIGEQDVPNPDVLMDWNKFFKKVSNFKLCPTQNSNKTLKVKTVYESRYTTDTILNISSKVVDQSKSLSAALSNVVHYSSEEIFDDTLYSEIFAKVQYKLIGKMQPIPHFQVNARIKGNLLGFSGKYGLLLFNLSLNFLSHGNVSCSNGNCESLWNVCAVINIPTDLLLESKFPVRCDSHIAKSSNFIQLFFLDTQESYKNYLHSQCIDLDYASNPKLTEMLSLHDRSIINLHLMHTSYFMFVMVMTLICYSLIKGRYRPLKHSYSLDKGLLDT